MERVWEERGGHGGRGGGRRGNGVERKGFCFVPPSTLRRNTASMLPSLDMSSHTDYHRGRKDGGSIQWLPACVEAGNSRWCVCVCVPPGGTECEGGVSCWVAGSHPSLCGNKSSSQVSR